jgi:hypothetical protein
MSNRKTLGGVRGAAPALLALIAIVGWGAIAHAAPQNGLAANETLSQLIALNGPGGGVQIGSLIFNNFSYVGSASPNAAPDAAHISVSNAPFSGTGLEFSAAWDAFNGGSPQESKISYWVHAVTGFVVTQTQLDFNGAVVAPGAPNPVPAGTQTSVTESVYNADSNGNPIGSPQQLSVFNNSNTGSAAGNQSSITLSSPQSNIFVQKDLQLTATSNAVTTVSFVDNTYGVAAGGVPEPASLGLMSMMGIALLSRRRRA